MPRGCGDSRSRGPSGPPAEGRQERASNRSGAPAVLRPRPLRVAVVDDDRWLREQRAAALCRTGRIEVVLVGDHADALARSGWDDVDVLMVDGDDGTFAATGGELAGVRVVERVRLERSPAQTGVAVLTGLPHDAVKVRMAAAGADVLYGHAQICTPAALVSVVEAVQPIVTRH